jgi:hypothetical protein
MRIGQFTDEEVLRAKTIVTDAFVDNLYDSNKSFYYNFVTALPDVSPVWLDKWAALGDRTYIDTMLICHHIGQDNHPDDFGGEINYETDAEGNTVAGMTYYYQDALIMLRRADEVAEFISDENAPYAFLLCDLGIPAPTLAIWESEGRDFAQYIHGYIRLIEADISITAENIIVLGDALLAGTDVSLLSDLLAGA